MKKRYLLGLVAGIMILGLSGMNPSLANADTLTPQEVADLAFIGLDTETLGVDPSTLTQEQLNERLRLMALELAGIDRDLLGVDPAALTPEQLQERLRQLELDLAGFQNLIGGDPASWTPDYLDQQFEYWENLFTDLSGGGQSGGGGTATPIPGAFWLLASGLTTLTAVARRKKGKKPTTR